MKIKEPLTSNDKLSIVSFLLSVLSYLYIALVFYIDYYNTSRGNHGFSIFFFFPVVPGFISSLTLGIASCKSRKKIYSYIGIALTALFGLFIACIPIIAMIGFIVENSP
jgi:hypothetical protein